MVVVADTSALVSLAIASDESPIQLLFTEYDVRVPPAVIEELEEIASSDDTHAEAATRVLDQLDERHVQHPSEQPEYPLDVGETEAIALANELSAEIFLCDEYGELSTVHALVSSSRLLTTPKMMEALVLRGVLSTADARAALSEMVDERSWRNNSYVTQFRARFSE